MERVGDNSSAFPFGRLAEPWRKFFWKTIGIRKNGKRCTKRNRARRAVQPWNENVLECPRGNSELRKHERLESGQGRKTAAPSTSANRSSREERICPFSASRRKLHFDVVQEKRGNDFLFPRMCLLSFNNVKVWNIRSVPSVLPSNRILNWIDYPTWNAI